MQAQAHLSLPVVVAFLVAFVAQATRLLTITKSQWNKLPAWVQGWLPPLLPFLASLGASLAGVQSWTDLTYAALGAFMLALPGAPSNRTAPESPAKKASVPPPMATFMLLVTLVVPIAIFCSACGLVGPSSPVAGCAPTPNELRNDVVDILFSGDGYEKALAERALERGQTVIDCAVQSVLDDLKSGKVADSPARTAARERAESYLAKHRVK